MIDIKYLKENIQTTADTLKTRGYDLNVNQFKKLDENCRKLQLQTQEMQEIRNNFSKIIGKLKSEKKDATQELSSAEINNSKLKIAEDEYRSAKNKVNEILAEMPNIPDESVPTGKNESDNVEVRKFGVIPEFSSDFKIKDHVEVGENLNGLDFKTATKITGSRFVIMKNQIAKLHRALIQFMLDVHVDEHGYSELNVPYLVNDDSLYGTGQLPKFSEDIFSLKGDLKFSLIPTAEVPVTNMFRNEIVNGDILPLKYVAHTPCFRSEAGSYGCDTRGMIRQHQFEKVELVHIVKPEDGKKTLETLTSHAENILRKLDLPYRVVNLCSGDMGFSAKKTYDIEVWIPSQNTYREISSCSWCGDFQARRMQARYKGAGMKKPELLHTLNGSGLAVGRTLVAILENYQQEDGSLLIPKQLVKYMNGVEKIN